MPESAKGQNKSYKDYIMGTGYDMVEKTPEWAAPITQIPAERIRELAADMAAAKAPFICQGWGPQRHTNGEDTSRAICAATGHPRQDRPARHELWPARRLPPRRTSWEVCRPEKTPYK